MRYLLLFLPFIAIQATGQVLDVNSDGTVGPHEALAVCEEWKGQAKAANAHNHLRQTWEGEGTPFKIRGSFSEPIDPVFSDSQQKDIGPVPRSPSAPLILENTNQEGYGLKVESQGVGASIFGQPTLVLGGTNPILAATEDINSSLFARANNHFKFRIDYDENGIGTFDIYGPLGGIATFMPDGDLFLTGEVQKSAASTRIDHPLDPANQYLIHSSVESPDMINVYNGNVVLDGNGEAWVQLPSYFEAYNTSPRYQLTCIGRFAPVYVAEKIRDNQFKIAGGNPDQELSWQVTGIRQDAFAKANPIEVEQEKSEDAKGKYLHPELFGEPVEKSVSLLPSSEFE
jgi:hypothetical protein